MVSRLPATNLLQFAVFFVVMAGFTNIYLTQPILPLLQAEFAVDISRVSLTVSAVILGIALANLPFGLIVDHFSIRPIIVIGGVIIVVGSVVCFFASTYFMLVFGRFIQGIGVPALTTCLAAHLAKTLPKAQLKPVFAGYVSATVVGGLGGRFLIGIIHDETNWRWGFISGAALVVIALWILLYTLPKDAQVRKSSSSNGYKHLLLMPKLRAIFYCAAASFAVFSSIFNLLPFRVQSEPLELSTRATTWLYSAYVLGVVVGPFVGRWATHHGSAVTMRIGTVALACGLGLTLFDHVVVIMLALCLICAGFFTIHSSAVGALNSLIESGQGRANALYILFYYVGGWLGITLSAFIFTHSHWLGVVLTAICALFFTLRCARELTQHPHS